MANKKTVVQMYEELLAIPTLTAEQKSFIEKRIEITKNKNAKRSTEPTPKQREKMEQDAGVENEIVSVMESGVQYTATDLLKLVSVASTQALTPRLTALVKNGRLANAKVKGRSVYSLPTEE